MDAPCGILPAVILIALTIIIALVRVAWRICLVPAVTTCTTILPATLFIATAK